MPNTLNSLDLEGTTIKALADNNITDIDSLFKYNTVEKLLPLRGIRARRAKKIIEAMEKYKTTKTEI